MSKGPLHVLQSIEQRKRKGLFRALSSDQPRIDFAGNDYLGFSRDGLIENKIASMGWQSSRSGSTGSRLISGNSALAEELEEIISKFHNAESALLFNSGYDANLGLLSCIATKNDLILFDELIHASLYDGIRLSLAKHYKFRHNDLEHLKDLVAKNKEQYENIFVVVESVYSMDGDSAPLNELVDVAQPENIFLIVDEAHAIGVFGKHGAGLCNELQVESDCFARIYTFGKGMGCHGAAIVGSKSLKDYLVNYARSFIYTTALPAHSLFCIKAAYRLLEETDRIELLRTNINYFNDLLSDPSLIKSESAIHCKVYGSITEAEQAESLMAENDFFVKSIKSPTVKEGTERIRICLHAFNTKDDIKKLCSLIS
jgi:8-amino-7-oxononanoate synthase